MHTPEQAASLWCPMVRIGVMPAAGGPSTVNDPTSISEFSGRCIADKCAMWRWPSSVKIRPDDGSLIMPGLGGDIPAKGYCGLAGRPEVM